MTSVTIPQWWFIGWAVILFVLLLCFARDHLPPHPWNNISFSFWQLDSWNDSSCWLSSLALPMNLSVVDAFQGSKIFRLLCCLVLSWWPTWGVQIPTGHRKDVVVSKKSSSNTVQCKLPGCPNVAYIQFRLHGAGFEARDSAFGESCAQLKSFSEESLWMTFPLTW